MLRFSAPMIVPCLALTLCAVEQTKTPKEISAQTALAEFNDLIGGWRGIGQPQRGSARGAWKETADWTWSFEKKEPALIYKIEDGKHLASVRLTFSPEKKSYLAKVTYADDSTRNFAGKLDEKRLRLVSDPDDEGQRQRLTITRLNAKRTLVLLERSIAEDRFFRIAEVGYTREGTRLAIPGTNGPECIVTGGRGTTPVKYNGKTYCVCCTGCKQAFEDDPEGIIAAYEERLAARKSGK
jgi:hypothetical protein